jgi:serine/threonine-protein kinase
MDGERPFMVMEMLEGEPLADRLKRLGRLTPAETYRVISHVARAVSKAHEAEIIHRDLKPDNVFLVHNEGDEIAKVLDFGVAKVESTQLDGEGHTRTGSLLGTPYYMSPEQAQGNKDIDPRSDLWALGVIAFECLTGKRPFSSDGLGDLVLQICIRDIPVPSAVVPVPPGFDAWFKKACEREPAERFQSARDLAESLRPALDLGSEPGGSIPESRWASAASAHAVSPMSAAPTLGSETTQPDPPRSTTDERTTEVDSATAAKSTNDEPDKLNLSDSQWEVVPHGEKQSEAQGDASEQGRPTKNQASPGDSEEGEAKGAGGSIAFVALIALLLGGAIVFGAKQAGVAFGGDEDPSDAPRVAPRVLPPPTKVSTPTPLKKKKSGSALAAEPGAEGETQDPDAEEPSDEDRVDGEEPTGAEESEGEGEEGAEGEAGPPEEDALDAIEDAAAAALKEREEAEAKKNAADGKDGEDKPSGAPPSDGPQPKLPAGLAPAPAPPPPPK